MSEKKFVRNSEAVQNHLEKKMASIAQENSSAAANPQPSAASSFSRPSRVRFELTSDLHAETKDPNIKKAKKMKGILPKGNGILSKENDNCGTLPGAGLIKLRKTEAAVLLNVSDGDPWVEGKKG